MFSFFTRNNKIKEEIEDDDDVEDEEEIEDCLKSKYMIYADENVSYFMSPVRSIIHVKEWAEQRPLNEEHIRNLVKSLSNKKDIVGSFKIIIDIENRTRIIDGNHRVNALRRIMKKDIELREVSSIDSEEAIA